MPHIYSLPLSYPLSSSFLSSSSSSLLLLFSSSLLCVVLLGCRNYNNFVHGGEIETLFEVNYGVTWGL
ncbi:hypothetical protein LINPERHAP1_LOCUS24467 [Linum perenne]